MRNNEGFGSWESICLLINMIFVQAILYFPKDAAGMGGSAGWIIPIAVTIISYIYFAIATGFYRQHGSLGLLEICEKSAGKVFKIIVGLLAALLLMILEVSLLGEYAHSLKIVSLDKSPLAYILVLFLVGMIAAAYYGIEVVARISAFIVPICILGFILITIGVIPEYHIDNLFPILGKGVSSIISGSTVSLHIFSPLLLIFFLIPFFKRRNLKRVGYLSITISGLILFWSTLSFLLTYPYEMAAGKKIPIFQMARLIEVGNYIQRVESVFVLVFSLASILYMGALFSFIIHIIAKTLDLDRHQPIILPTAVILYTMTFYKRGLPFHIPGNQMANILWILAFLLPIIVLIIGSVKKVTSENEGGQDCE